MGKQGVATLTQPDVPYGDFFFEGLLAQPLGAGFQGPRPPESMECMESLESMGCVESMGSMDSMESTES